MSAPIDWLLLLVIGPVVLALAIAWGIFVARRGSRSIEERRRRDAATRSAYREDGDR